MNTHHIKTRLMAIFFYRSNLTAFTLIALIPVVLFAMGGLLFFPMPVSAESTLTIQAGSNKSCSPGTLLELTSGGCFSIRDVRGKPIKQQQKLAASPVTPPSLLELRRQRLMKPGFRALQGDMPPPGGIGVGTTYRVGAIQANDSSELHTKMFVQPGGINPSNSGLDWLFTTATNRTQQGVEVAGIYFQNSPNGSLGIFDWSCSSNSPCDVAPEPVTGPSWIWVTDFTNLTCNIKRTLDQGGHLQNVIQYVNKTSKLNNDTPPLWKNAVFLWNSCDNKWDLVWEHRYKSDQADCSTDNGCGGLGWWGPILETFASESGEEFPEINELGFEQSAILHDGIWSDLSPAETNFDYPAFPWMLFHLDSNRGYGVGNHVTALTKGDCKNSGWKVFGFKNQGQCIKFVNTGN